MIRVMRSVLLALLWASSIWSQQQDSKDPQIVFLMEGKVRLIGVASLRQESTGQVLVSFTKPVRFPMAAQVSMPEGTREKLDAMARELDTLRISLARLEVALRSSPLASVPSSDPTTK